MSGVWIVDHGVWGMRYGAVLTTSGSGSRRVSVQEEIFVLSDQVRLLTDSVDRLEKPGISSSEVLAIVVGLIVGILLGLDFGGVF